MTQNGMPRPSHTAPELRAVDTAPGGSIDRRTMAIHSHETSRGCRSSQPSDRRRSVLQQAPFERWQLACTDLGSEALIDRSKR